MANGQPTEERSTLSSRMLPWLLYAAMLAAYLIASFFPAARLWGFSIFAYFPTGLTAATLVAAVLVGGVAAQSERRLLADTIDSRKGPTLVAAAVGLVMLAGFVLLQAKTFFLGDGYTLISDLASHNPMIHKNRELLESAAHVWLFEALGGSGRAAAVDTYQVISIVSGALYLMVAWIGAFKIFCGPVDRLLFFVGIVSGGWMLLYFGYAENYSMFVLFVTAYLLLGLRVMQGGSGRWLVALLQILLLGFHLLAVTFIPATVYLLLHDTAVSRSLARLSGSIRIMVGTVLAAIVIAAFVMAVRADLFLQVTLVPLLDSPLVPEGYTLFSAAHLLDYVNLLALLLPGLPLLIYGIFRLPVRAMSAKSVYRWLGIAAAGALGAAFLIDPKLGMPRDWDLFAFAGLPLGIGLVYGLVSHRKQPGGAGRIVLLTSVLGFTALGARAAWQATPAIGVAHYRDYLQLDRVKNRNGWVALSDYYLQAGDTTTATAVQAEFRRTFPEEELMEEATRRFHVDHDTTGAEAQVRRILEINPAYPDAYAFLGYIYMAEGRYDRALEELDRAEALSPGRAKTLNTRAQVYFRKGDYSRAEDLLRRAATLDSTNYNMQYNLARFYLSRKDAARYVEYLQKAAANPDAPATIIEELIVVYVRQGRTGEARHLYCGTAAVRADTTFPANVVAMLPGIDTLLVCR